MASAARSNEFDPLEVNVLHCYCRFVQQLWLFGTDPNTHKNGAARRQWLQDLVEFAARVFLIDIGVTATMVNHFHLVIRNRPDIAQLLPDDDVIFRWVQISHLTKSCDGVLREPTEEQLAKERAKCQADPDRINKLRLRLADPSQFMKCINENLALRINRDGGTAGSVFEDRFKCKKVVGEAAQIALALYVDLNAIRSGEAEVLEDSQYTSIYERIMAWLVSKSESEDSAPTASQSEAGPDIRVEEASAKPEMEMEASSGITSPPLSPVEVASSQSQLSSIETTPESTAPDQPTTGPKRRKRKSRKYGPAAPRAPRAAWLGPIELGAGPEADVEIGKRSSTPWRASDKGWFPISQHEYTSLLDWVARDVRSDKPGATPAHLAPILLRVGLNPVDFLHHLKQFSKLFRYSIGSRAAMEAEATQGGRRRRVLKISDCIFTSA